MSALLLIRRHYDAMQVFTLPSVAELWHYLYNVMEALLPALSSYVAMGVSGILRNECQRYLVEGDKVIMVANGLPVPQYRWM